MAIGFAEVVAIGAGVVGYHGLAVVGMEVTHVCLCLEGDVVSRG